MDNEKYASLWLVEFSSSAGKQKETLSNSLRDVLYALKIWSRRDRYSQAGEITVRLLARKTSIIATSIRDARAMWWFGRSLIRKRKSSKSGL
jgi:hypothetical protein